MVQLYMVSVHARALALTRLCRRRRRDSGYARGRGKGLKQHERGYFMVNKPRRHSLATHVPDPPRIRSRSYERLSNDPIEVEHRISEAKAEAFAAGFKDRKRLWQDHAFIQLRATADFAELIGEVQLR